LARRRFFVPSVDNGLAELRGEDAHHLARVLRAEPGQRYEISDGNAAFLAEIAEVANHRVAFRVIEPAFSAQPPVRITLCAALFKFDHFEWMVEKATELGVDRIIPFEAARTDRGLFDAAQKRSARWEKIAYESAQQSRRLKPPAIGPAVRFSEAVSTLAGHRYLLDEGAAPPLLSLVPAARNSTDSAALLLGPEGGWTDAERATALAASWTASSLGPQILRAETAAAAALAVLVNAWMV
jgi:16S rRNA (uracil1498-N3)-methyltransferase